MNSVTVHCLPATRSLTPTWPATNTGDDAVRVMKPVVALGVTVTPTAAKRYQGWRIASPSTRNRHSSSDQLVSPVRLSLRGATSG